jgi:hypothetical protein
MIDLPLRIRIRNALRHTALRKALYWHRHRGVTSRDVILGGYPRSGTTWITFMLVELAWRPGGEHNLRDARFSPNVGVHHDCQSFLPGGGRLLRSHERYHGSYHKAICILRDPRDAAVSQYFNVQRTTGLSGSFSEFLPYFLRGTFTGAGPWDRYVHEWLDSPPAQTGDAIVVKYEDIQADAHRQVRRMAPILGINPSNDDIERAASAGKFDVMRAREKTTEGVAHREQGAKIHAIRKGVVGDWRNHLTLADQEKFAQALGQAAKRAGYDLTPVTATAQPQHVAAGA